MSDDSVAFLETHVFKKVVEQLLDEEEFRELQNALLIDPKRGDVIPRTGGVRKLRFHQRTKKRGKRGGVRVIYYHRTTYNTILLVLAYEKTHQDDLTPEQERLVKKLVERYKGA